MGVTGRFWGCDRETGKIDWDQFEASEINEEQLRLYLKTKNHKAGDFDILPKYLFNID